MKPKKQRLIHLRDGSTTFKLCSNEKILPEYLTSDRNATTCPKCRKWAERFWK